MYHLSGAVQEALECLSRQLKVPLDPTTDTWNGLINKIDSAFKAKQASSPKKTWKALEPFYSELVSDIKAIKNAWRNPTIHSVERDYSEEEAEDVFFHEPLVVSSDVRHSKSEKRYYALGQTATGRRLFVVFTVRRKLIRVISVRDMNRNESARYERHEKENS